MYFGQVCDELGRLSRMLVEECVCAVGANYRASLNPSRDFVQSASHKVVQRLPSKAARFYGGVRLSDMPGISSHNHFYTLLHKAMAG